MEVVFMIFVMFCAFILIGFGYYLFEVKPKKEKEKHTG